MWCLICVLGLLGLVFAPQVVGFAWFAVGLLFASWSVWFGSVGFVRFAVLICVGYDFFWFLLLYIVIDCYYG